MDSFVSHPRRTIIPTEKVKPAGTSETASESENSLRKPLVKSPPKNKKIAAPPARLPIPDPLDGVPATHPVPKPRKTHSPIWNELYHISPEGGGALLDAAGHKLFRCRLYHERTPQTDGRFNDFRVYQGTDTVMNHLEKKHNVKGLRAEKASLKHARDNEELGQWLAEQPDVKRRKTTEHEHNIDEAMLIELFGEYIVDEDAFDAATSLFKRTKLLRPLLILGLVVLVFVTTLLFHNSGSLSSLPNAVDDLPVPHPAGSPAQPPGVPHPIRNLITSAREEFARTRSRQSKILEEATTEYRRRYKIPPPPYFEKWYNFALEINVQLIDEYDSIYHSLLPFWGMSPQSIRKRTRKALGSDDFLMTVFVRNGQVTKVERGQEWRQKAISGMMEKFVRYLPDMDMAFNLHDEPRVILPNEDLERLIEKAQRDIMPKAAANKSPRNAWSAKPEDVNDGHIEPYIITPFNEYAHQFTWTVSRLSCPVNTPARALDYDDRNIADRLAGYISSDLGFIYNRTAFTDICLSPSLMENFGFFNLPNAWSVTHDLIPIFSSSKISSFQDFLYPSPWYWADKVVRNETKDLEWNEKLDRMYWRGSTTSGYSQDGIWHRQHRQRFLKKVNKPGPGKVLEYEHGDGVRAPEWHVKEVQLQDFSDLFDVHFTSVGQCSPSDCDDQLEYFDIYDASDFQEAWMNKYLLDMDGNAFSGRFYTFLQSKSLTFKLALFREWHEEWLTPWAHYVPLSVRGDEHLESLRYFNSEEDGKVHAKQIADNSRAWAGQALRHVDMEAWFFRLLLEYVDCP
jgi:Glycosyl transferase family 90